MHVATALVAIVVLAITYLLVHLLYGRRGLVSSNRKEKLVDSDAEDNAIRLRARSVKMLDKALEDNGSPWPPSDVSSVMSDDEILNLVDYWKVPAACTPGVKMRLSKRDSELTIGHIVPTSHDDYYSHLMNDYNVTDIRNTLYLPRWLHILFNECHWCAMLDDAMRISSPIRIKVLVPRDFRGMFHNWTEALHKLNGTILNFPDGRYPSFRCLAHHAMQCHVLAIRNGWISDMSDDVISGCAVYVHLCDGLSAKGLDRDHDDVISQHSSCVMSSRDEVHVKQLSIGSEDDGNESGDEFSKTQQPRLPRVLTQDDIVVFDVFSKRRLLSLNGTIRVCLLQNNDELEQPVDLYPFLNKLTQGVHPELIISSYIVPCTSPSTFVKNLATSGRFDVFINLCDSPRELNYPGVEVVHCLLEANAAFTGADVSFFEPPKSLMKTRAVELGVNTARYVFAYGDRDIKTACAQLKFPVIVKHFNGYGSVGMTRKSRCCDAMELMTEAGRMISEYGGALIEEFIEGKECTVLVVEGEDNDSIALLPVECCFPAGETFKHYDLKWVDWQGLTWKPVADRNLDVKLRQAARKMFEGLNGRSYGRCDFRVDADGEPYFLEINPQCGVLYPYDTPGSADTILMLDEEMCHGKFIHHIIRLALREQQQRKTKHKNNDAVVEL